MGFNFATLAPIGLLQIGGAAYADLLGLERQAMVLRTTLEEEKETDARLTLAAREINVEAAEG